MTETRSTDQPTAFGVEDDGTPRAALDIAGQGVRAFNHRTLVRPEPGRLVGWEYPSDAYTSLGELTYLAGVLPQAFQQIIAALRHQLEQGHIAIDPDTTYAGDPPAAIDAASIALEKATHAADQIHQAVSDAQNAINAASYAGPDIDD